MPEKILGVIDNAIIAGLVTKKVSNLAFTRNRIIVAIVVNAEQFFEAVGSIGGMEGGGGGKVATMVITEHAAKEAVKMRSRTPESILRANKDNFSIPYETITEINFVKGDFYRVSGLKVTTLDKKYKFVFANRGDPVQLSQSPREELLSKYLKIVESAFTGRLTISKSSITSVVSF